MGSSLQDQLLQAGLATEKQAKQPKAGKGPKQQQKKGQRGPELSDSAKAAQQAMAEKAERDRELNERRKQKAERKALRAQVKQLIDDNRLHRGEAELGYHFEDNGKVRKLYVTPGQQQQLARGQLDIVRFDGCYDLVPAEVARRIAERDAACVIPRRQEEARTADPDDPYAAYQVPDDLMW